MEWAVAENKLEYDLILDMTDSSGGSNCVYPIRRFTDKSFKITKGNLRISDITKDFIALRSKIQIGKDRKYYAKKAEIDDGNALKQWLNGQVMDSCNSGAEYSNNLVFKKLYHTTNDSISPNDVHFKGRLVALFGPSSGSQIDQLSSILVDNKLAYCIGMSTGGFSNTWEWREEITNPNTGHVICNFMWTIGHTIRPNGEILEGNPPKVDDVIMPTKDNFLYYKNVLISKSMAYLKNHKN